MMMRRRVFRRVLALAAAVTSLSTAAAAQPTLRVVSPDGKNVVTVSVRQGTLSYSLDRQGTPLLLPSRLGFELRGAPPLGDSVRIVDSAATTAKSVREQLAGARLLGGTGRTMVRFLATDGAERFARVGTRFLGQTLSPENVELVDL